MCCLCCREHGDRCDEPVFVHFITHLNPVLHLLLQLIQPMPIMIWIAVIVQAAIQNWLDMGILLGIQFANATIGWWAPAAVHITRSIAPGRSAP